MERTQKTQRCSTSVLTKAQQVYSDYKENKREELITKKMQQQTGSSDGKDTKTDSIQTRRDGRGTNYPKADCSSGDLDVR